MNAQPDEGLTPEQKRVLADVLPRFNDQYSDEVEAIVLATLAASRRAPPDTTAPAVTAIARALCGHVVGCECEPLADRPHEPCINCRETAELCAAALSVAAEPKEGAPPRFVIWSGEWRQYWGPNSSGYFEDVRQAGRYSRQEADAIAARCGPEKKIEVRPAPPLCPICGNVRSVVADVPRQWRTSPVVRAALEQVAITISSGVTNRYEDLGDDHHDAIEGLCAAVRIAAAEPPQETCGSCGGHTFRVVCQSCGLTIREGA